MGAQDSLTGEAMFELVSLPEPLAVRDPDTGAIVDGYRFTVRSKATGAIATLEIPKARYSAEYVAAQAVAALAPLDETIVSFGKAGMTGVPPAG